MRLVVGSQSNLQVTVLVAAFNAEQCIGRAIASAQAQADVKLEILVVDDGSTDATRDVVEALAHDDERIRLIRLAQNCGPSAARNAGLDAATGDWIAILDADDSYLPGRLQHLLDIAEKSGADIVADNFYWFDFDNGPCPDPALAEVPSEEVLDRYSFVDRARPFAPEIDVGLLKPMFRLAFLNAHRLRYDVAIRHGEDFHLIFHALLRGACYVFSRNPFYLYTLRTSGFSRTRIDYQAQRSRTIQLRSLPPVRDDPRLSRLLNQRAAALARLHLEREARRLQDKQDFISLAALLLPRLDGWKLVARSLIKKMHR